METLAQKELHQVNKKYCMENINLSVILCKDSERHNSVS